MKYSRLSLKNVFRPLILAASLFAFSCASTPDPSTLPDDDRSIVQLAQDATDAGNTKLAKWYYNQLLLKFGDNPKCYVEANFEIAHLDIKKKNYEEAVPRLNELLYLYANTAPGFLPGQYKKLAENDLKKIPEDVLEKINQRLSQDNSVSVDDFEVEEEPEDDWWDDEDEDEDDD